MAFKIGMSDQNQNRVDISWGNVEAKDVKIYGGPVTQKMAGFFGLAKRVKTLSGEIFYVDKRSLGKQIRELKASPQEQLPSGNPILDKMKHIPEKIGQYLKDKEAATAFFKEAAKAQEAVSELYKILEQIGPENRMHQILVYSTISKKKSTREVYSELKSAIDKSSEVPELRNFFSITRSPREQEAILAAILKYYS